ncbi:MFS transporter [Stackebrandtia endophytica]|uniref:MFS transporter n=1 Tax=Stackebrandtia endophytica TaxID=1496996 RepID=UPI001150EA75
MPAAVYVLAAGVFTMVTSEFAVAGLMPQLADSLGTGIEQIGYLVTVFAIAMTVGGPALTLALLRVTPRTALLTIFVIFFAGNLLAASATSYPAMVAARVVTGVAAQAFFGIAISLCARLVDPGIRGRAVGVALNGLMLGTLLGLPLATLIGGRLGWQAAFWGIAVLTVIAAGLTLALVRNPVAEPDSAEVRTRLTGELAVFRRPQLLLALASSTMIIGATFAMFSFLTPILTRISGFGGDTVPLLLLAYGAATLLGNIVVGRLADRHTGGVLLIGTTLNLAFLVGFALLADVPLPAVVFMLGIGLVGITMNPAMAVRVQRAGSTRPLVNTVHASFITLGVILGSGLGSALIPGHGLRAPIVLGIGFAVVAVISVLPMLRNPHLRNGTRPEVEMPSVGSEQPGTMSAGASN